MVKKYALLVGLNKYKLPGNDLNGCVNDIRDVREMLIARGWGRNAKFIEMKDDLATKESIVDGLLWLITAAEHDDQAELLFHYSGHGSQVPTKETDEVDHLSEILCPYDYGDHWGDPINDKTLKSIFKAKPEHANLTVILDCCHSGTATRNLAGMMVKRSVNRSRYVPFPDMPMGYEADVMPVNRLGIKQRNGYKEICPDMNHVLLSACRSSQTADDAVFGGRPNGAWTWALLRALRVMDQHAKARDVFSRARLMVREEGFGQVPQIEGRKDLAERMFLGGPDASD